MYDINDLHKLDVGCIKSIIYTDNPDLFSKSPEEIDALFINVETLAIRSLHTTSWLPQTMSFEKHVSIIKNRIAALDFVADKNYRQFLLWTHICHLPESLTALRHFDYDPQALCTYAPYDITVLKWRYAHKFFETVTRLTNLRRKSKDHISTLFFASDM